MNEDMVMNVGTEAIKVTIMLAGPMLLAALVVGLFVSVLQAITQINEATLTFIPKMVAIIVVMVIMAPWMLEVITQYTTQVIGGAGDMIR